MFSLTDEARNIFDLYQGHTGVLLKKSGMYSIHIYANIYNVLSEPMEAEFTLYATNNAKVIDISPIGNKIYVTETTPHVVCNLSKNFIFNAKKGDIIDMRLSLSQRSLGYLQWSFYAPRISSMDTYIPRAYGMDFQYLGDLTNNKTLRSRRNKNRN